MALQGDLRELAVVDLIQLIHRIHQTGALTLTGTRRQALLFYREGQLVDARAGMHSGVEALVEIVDWTSGSFVFEQGVAPQEETIQMDLHRVIMHALKTRDERKEEQRRKAAEESRNRVAVNSTLMEELTRLAAASEQIVYVGLADAEGVLLAETRSAKAPEGVDALRDWLLAMAKSHPGGGCKKVFLENEIGTAVLARAGGDRIAVALAEKGAPFGAVSLWVGKLIARLAALEAQPAEPVAVQ